MERERRKSCHAKVQDKMLVPRFDALASEHTKGESRVQTLFDHLRSQKKQSFVHSLLMHKKDNDVPCIFAKMEALALLLPIRSSFPVVDNSPQTRLGIVPW